MPFESNKQPIDAQKLRGGYYTPSILSDFLVQWSIRSRTERILEPSCGDGNFVVSLLTHIASKSSKKGQSHIEAVFVEKDKQEIVKAQRRSLQIKNTGSKLQWLPEDFFVAYPKLREGDRFDVLLGNPPYIRFQYFDKQSQELAFEHLRSAGYHPTKLANAWTAFVQLGIELLNEGGRLAMVLPAEMLQVSYTAELRTRLSIQFEHITIVGFKTLVFPEIQQEVVLLLADGKTCKKNIQSDIHTVEFKDGSFLTGKNVLKKAIAHIPAKHSHGGMKWTSLFLGAKAYDAINLASQDKRLVQLKTLASVQVGVVTGRNKFFVLTQKEQKALGCEKLTIPIVCKTTALKSIRFDKEEFARYCETYPAYLLNTLGTDEAKFPKQLLKYIKDGEDAKVNDGFKCRIRKRWYDVPSIYVPDAFMFRQVHLYPLMVANHAGAVSTDTIHRVNIKKGVDVDLLSASLFNSLTLAWAEVCGRSYGGGVLELEPSEASALPVFYSTDIGLDPKKVNDLLKCGKASEALDYVDNIVLVQALGFKKTFIANIRSAWNELRDRRMGRH